MGLPAHAGGPGGSGSESHTAIEFDQLTATDLPLVPGIQSEYNTVFLGQTLQFPHGPGAHAATQGIGLEPFHFHVIGAGRIGYQLKHGQFLIIALTPDHDMIALPSSGILVIDLFYPFGGTISTCARCQICFANLARQE